MIYGEVITYIYDAFMVYNSKIRSKENGHHCTLEGSIEFQILIAVVKSQCKIRSRFETRRFMIKTGDDWP